MSETLPQAPAPGPDPETTAGSVPASTPAPVPPPVPQRRGMFGVTGTGDTSGFGGLVVPPAQLGSAARPYGGWFDAAADDLERAFPEFGQAIERVVVELGELTLHVRPAYLLALCHQLRDDPRLRFELCSSVSGVDYPADPTGRRFHVVYHLTSLSYRRHIRLEVSVAESAPHVPSIVPVYPTANWHERETWDFFGIIFDGHPALTRILMPDDWPGHPQRKDYPLGGVGVEYKGAKVPPPDERRGYA